MRTLLIHQAFATPDSPGGTRHFELAQHVVERGHAFTVVASNRNYLTGKVFAPSSFGQDDDYDGLRVLRAYAAPTLHQSFALRVVSFISFMLTSILVALRAGPVDVVMGTTPPIFQAVSAWLIAVIRRRPFLLEIRDLWPEFAIDMGVLTNPFLITSSRALESFLYWAADHILVNSPVYRDYLTKKGVAAAKISVIPNGVQYEKFDPDDDGEPQRKQWGVEGKYVAMYAGAMGIANDLTVLVKAAKLLSENDFIHIIFVGDGKECTSLQRLAVEMGLTNVTFVGTVAKSRMPEVLAASDACIATLQNIPMFRTGYPNKIFDYMAAGRPTVLAIDGITRGMVEEAKAGLYVPPGNPQQLALAILALATNPEAGHAMGRAARTYVAENFDRAQQADRFVELLETVGRGTRVDVSPFL